MSDTVGRPNWTRTCLLILGLTVAIGSVGLAQTLPSQWTSPTHPSLGLTFTLGYEGQALNGELEFVGEETVVLVLVALIDGLKTDEAGVPVYFGYATFDDDGVADDDMLAFELYVVDENDVTLVLGEVGDDGDIVYEGAQEISYVPADASEAAPAAMPAPTQPNPTPAPASPPNQAPPAASDVPAPPATGPSAGAELLVGTFEGQGLTVTVRRVVSSYSGSLSLGDRSYPYAARATERGMAGTFHADGNEYTFEADLEGNVLTVRTGGATYRTVRLGGS